MIEFVTTPTEEWLRAELLQCKVQFLVSSPYVGEWLSNIYRSLSIEVRKLLLTRTDLRDFASGASDLEAVCNLAFNGTEVMSSHRLHAKVYVVDDLCGLVTSANATFSGMRSNLECGLVIRDAQGVSDAAKLVLSAFGARESPQRWSLSDLQSLREPVRLIKETLSARLVTPLLENRILPDVHPEKPVGRALREHLPGWTRLALEGVQMQPAQFEIDRFVTTCAPLVAARYPANRHVRPKLRQQLQRLRDLGLIEFLGGGHYRRSA